MGDFRKNRRAGRGFGSDRSRGRSSRDSGDSRGFGRRSERRFSRDDDREPVEMHQAVCDKCGRECEVPFKPTSGKPLFCNDCFKKKNGSFDKPSGKPDSSAESLASIHKKLDKILEALEIE